MFSVILEVCMLKGSNSVSAIMQLVFVAILIIALFVFVMTSLTVPVYEAHGDVQASLLSQSVASKVSLFSTMESGKMTKRFDGEWDIKIYQDSDIWKVKFSHEGFEEESRILGNVKFELDDYLLEGRKDITIETRGGTIFVS